MDCVRYNIIPPSCSQFEAILQDCNTPQDISKKFPFIAAQKIRKMTWEIFFNLTSQLIVSYPDYSEEKLAAIVNKMGGIFKGKMSHLVNGFKQIRILRESLIKEREDFEKPKDSSQMLAPIDQENSTRVARFQRLLRGEEEVQLTTILNFLIMEEDLMNCVAPYLEGAFKFIELTHFTIARQLLVLNQKFPSNLSLVSDKSIEGLDPNYISFFRDGENTLISIKDRKLVDKNFRVDFYKRTKQYLLNLKSKDCTDDIKQFVERSLIFIELMDQNEENKDLKEKAKLQVNKIFRSRLYKLVGENLNQQPFWELVPFLVSSHSKLEKCFRENRINEVHNRGLKEINLKKVNYALDQWKTRREKQKSLFDYTSQRLLELVQNSQNRAPILEHILDDTSGKGNEPLRPFPGCSDGINWKDIISHFTIGKGKPAQAKQSDEWISSYIQEFFSRPPVNRPPRKKKQFTVKKMEDVVAIQELPGSLFPYNLHPRVSRWDRHPYGKPFPEGGKFPSFSGLSPDRQMWHHIRHAPNPLVDRHLHLGKATTGKNSRGDEVLNVVIPAEMAFQGEYYVGAMLYAIDTKTNTCFHRQFEEKTAVYDVEYPSLNSRKLTYSKTDYIESLDTLVSYSPDGSIRIKDCDKKIIIKLFSS